MRHGEVRPLRHSPRGLAPNPDLVGTMLVPLTKGLFAIIDEVDAPHVGQVRWQASFTRSQVIYAKSRWGHQHLVLWEHWGLPPTPEVDHENTNGLDCRRSNLRAATRIQNASNVGLSRANTSGHKGVHFDSQTGQWGAQIIHAGNRVWLGRFDRIEDAAAAYSEAAHRLNGDFARVG